MIAVSNTMYEELQRHGQQGERVQKLRSQDVDINRIASTEAKLKLLLVQPAGQQPRGRPLSYDQLLPPGQLGHTTTSTYLLHLHYAKDDKKAYYQQSDKVQQCLDDFNDVCYPWDYKDAEYTTNGHPQQLTIMHQIPVDKLREYLPMEESSKLKDVQPSALVLLHSVLVSEEVKVVELLGHTVVVAVAAGEDGVHQLKPRDADGAGRSGQSLATETA